MEYVVIDAVHGMKVKQIELPVQKCKGRRSSWWCDIYVLAPLEQAPPFCNDCEERVCRECFWVGEHQRACSKWESSQ